MAGLNTLTLTDGAWDTEVLNSDKPVLVDFGPSGVAHAGCWPRRSTRWRRTTKVV